MRIEQTNPFAAGTKITLDPLGQYCTAIMNPKSPGNFTISVHLKQPLHTEALQTAVNDLFRRLPFLNGKVVEGEFFYEHEILEHPPTIIQDAENEIFIEYYNKGEGHFIRVLYGENHFKTEAVHTMIDGRGLTAFTRALLVRYLEVLGVKVSKSDIIDCADMPVAEEVEDAYERYTTSQHNATPEANEECDGGIETKEVYYRQGSTEADTTATTLKFDLSKIKAKSKKYKTTINGYIFAHLMEVLEEERNERGIDNPITGLSVVDCRTYLPTKTFRNFTAAVVIEMPEKASFEEKVNNINNTFKGIDAAYIQKDINTFCDAFQNKELQPLSVLKKQFADMAEAEQRCFTTHFSNIGLVKFPAEVEPFVDYMELVLCPIPGDRAYAFGCISVGNVLTLTVTKTVAGNKVIENLSDRLKK